MTTTRLRTTGWAAVLASVLCAATAYAGTGAFESDAVVYARCPGVARWYETHPSSPDADVPPAAAADPQLARQLARLVAQDHWVTLHTGYVVGNPEATAARERRSDEFKASTDAFLRRILRVHGVPGPDLLGTDGWAAFWILVMHTRVPDAEDISFRILADYQVGDPRFPPDTMASLIDWDRERQGQPQRYGSRFNISGGSVHRDGPIEDPDHIDERRARMNLMPLADYDCGWIASMYHPPAPPQPRPKSVR